jgi:hypothetical protein
LAEKLHDHKGLEDTISGWKNSLAKDADKSQLVSYSLPPVMPVVPSAVMTTGNSTL